MTYNEDDEKIKHYRFWITFELFQKEYFQKAYMIWMDESAINNTSFCQKMYSEKNN